MKELLEWLREHESDVSKLLFLVAGIYGIVSVALYPPQFGPPVEMANLAANIAAHGNFSNPFFVLKTGPTAVIPPLYPLLLAGLIKLLRSPHLVYLVAVIGCIQANAVTAVLLPRVSIAFYGDAIPGFIASLFWIPAMPIIPSYDVSYTILGLVAFCLITSTLDQNRIIRKALVAGTVAASVLLFNPATLLVMFPWIVFIAWRRSGPFVIRLKFCCIIVAVMAVAIGGWGLRNYFRVGAFAVRTVMGMTLYTGNNDCAEIDHFRDQLYGCYDLYHPNTSIQEAQLLRSLGEVQYDRKRIADVKTWISAHPRRFAFLTCWRVVSFWFPRTLPSQAEMLQKAGYVAPEQVRGWITQRNRIIYVVRIATALSIPGLIVMLRRRLWVALYLITVFVLYPLMYYIVLSEMRFRFPILWLSLLPAGYLLTYVSGLRPGREQSVEAASCI